MRPFLLIALISIKVAQAAEGNEWVDDWQVFEGTLYGTWAVKNGTDTVIHNQTCTYINGQVRVELDYMKTDNTMGKVLLYLGANTTKIDQKNSLCAQVLDHRKITVDNGPLADVSYEMRSLCWGYTGFDLYNGGAHLTLYFSNYSEPPYLVPGWFAFAIYRMELSIDLNNPLMAANFPNAREKTLYYNGTSGASKESRWWKKLGAYAETSYQCNTYTSVQISDHMWFQWQNMQQLSALNRGWFYSDDFADDFNTLDPNVCNFDYEKDDALAVVIGSVQTGATLLCLFAYFVYLKLRGPVKVPNWIVEPAMRNADVRPIDERQYERRLTQLSAHDGVTQRQSTAANEKY